MIKIFSYGTLYDKYVQLSEFGTQFHVEDDMDYIGGYDIIKVKINDELYKVAVESETSLVSGAIVHVPESYIELIDKYEGKEYERKSITTLSGVDCQIYIKRVDK
jgi:gamma-glutamylcyclotransferase (GGCT)/AIG2-like uncharacterized protein YtfP